MLDVSKLKEGDVVRRIAKGRPEARIGDTFTVSIRRGEPSLRNCSLGLAFEENWELVEPAMPANKFKKGDKVRVQNLGKVWLGADRFNEGDITEVHSVFSGGVRVFFTKSPENGKPFDGKSYDRWLTFTNEEIAEGTMFHAEEDTQSTIDAKLAELEEANAKVNRLAKEIATLKAAKPNPRAAIILRAEKDVAHILSVVGTHSSEKREIGRGNFYFNDTTTEPEAIVNREKRTVVVLVRYKFRADDKWILARGIAKTSPGDEFIEIIGTAIALRRAYGLPVPQDYLDVGGM